MIHFILSALGLCLGWCLGTFAAILINIRIARWKMYRNAERGLIEKYTKKGPVKGP